VAVSAVAYRLLWKSVSETDFFFFFFFFFFRIFFFFFSFFFNVISGWVHVCCAVDWKFSSRQRCLLGARRCRNWRLALDVGREFVGGLAWTAFQDQLVGNRKLFERAGKLGRRLRSDLGFGLHNSGHFGRCDCPAQFGAALF
jgi:hypothetical protein